MATQPIHPTRVCRKCGIEKPHTTEHFVSKLGKLTPLCRECNKAISRAYFLANRERMLLGFREARKADPEFHRERQRRYYRENPEAHKASDKKYREANKEKRREAHRIWRKANPTKVAFYGERYRQSEAGRESSRRRSRQWRERHIERIREERRAAYHADPARHLEYGRRWYRKHRQRILEDARAWRKANPDKVREWGHRRRAVTEAPGGFKAQDVGLIYGEQDGLCSYCLADLNETCEADHFIPIARGGSNRRENIILACMPCNRSKGAKMPWEWRPDLFRAPPD